MIALRELQAAKVQKYKIEIYVKQNTRNLGYKIKDFHTRPPEIQQKTCYSG